MPAWEVTPFERTLDKPLEVSPYDRMQRLLESSADVSRLLSIARDMPRGEEVLLHLIRHRIAVIAKEHAFVATHSSSSGGH